MAVVSSVLAVKDFIVNTIVPGISFPSQITIFKAPIKAFRQMPPITTLGSRVIMIIGNYREVEKRISWPRGSGTKEISYEIPMLIHASTIDAKSGQDQFDLLVETVKNGFRTANTNVFITDPITGVSNVVYLFKIGEDMSGEGLTPITVDDAESGQSLMNLEYILRVKVTVNIQA